MTTHQLAVETAKKAGVVVDVDEQAIADSLAGSSCPPCKRISVR